MNAIGPPYLSRATSNTTNVSATGARATQSNAFICAAVYTDLLFSLMAIFCRLSAECSAGNVHEQCRTQNAVTPPTTARIAGVDILYGCQPPCFHALAKLSVAVFKASGRIIANNPKLKNITAITNRAGASERLGTTLYIRSKGYHRRIEVVVMMATR